jgi:hypothetical protein
MELFRVGGDVPDTNYLFMGMQPSLVLPHQARTHVEAQHLTRRTLLQVTSSTVAFTHSSLSSCFSASKSATPIA